MDSAEFALVVRRRRFMVNITLAAYVFLFVAALVAVMVTWNARNLQIGNFQRFKAAKNKLLFAAILAGIAGISGLLAVFGRIFSRGHTAWMPISVILFTLSSAMCGVSACLIYVYVTVGISERGKRQKFLKAVVGMCTIVIAILLFVLIFSVGVSRNIEQLVLQ